AGNLLVDAKRQVGHGEWLDWLRANCPFSERTAQAYMRLAREVPRLDEAKAQRVAGLSVRQAIRELSSPDKYEEGSEEEADQRQTALDLPALAPTREYRAVDDAGSTMIELTPPPKPPGFFIVGISLDLDTENNASVEYPARPMRLDLPLFGKTALEHLLGRY